MARRKQRWSIAAKRVTQRIETHVVHVTSFCDSDLQATERALYSATGTFGIGSANMAYRILGIL